MNKNDILNTDQLDDKNVVIGYQKSGYDINDDKDEYDDNYKLHNKNELKKYLKKLLLEENHGQDARLFRIKIFHNESIM